VTRRCFVAGLAGGTGAGKSTLVKGLVDVLGVETVAVLPSDAYYRDRGDLSPEQRNGVNYDHPEALEMDRLVSDLTRLRDGRMIERPVYDFETHSRLRETLKVRPAPMIVLEGILIFADGRLRALMDLKVFVEAPPDIRFIRRLHRDVVGRGRSVESVTKQYLESVRPMHQRFVESFRHFADLEIPGYGDPEKSVELLVRHVGEQWSGRRDAARRKGGE